MGTIIDDAVASGRSKALRGDIKGALSEIDLELRDNIRVSQSVLDDEHNRFELRWKEGGFFTSPDHMLKMYATKVVRLWPKPCDAA